MNPAMERWATPPKAPLSEHKRSRSASPGPRKEQQEVLETSNWSNKDDTDLHELMGFDDEGNSELPSHPPRPTDQVMTIIGIDDDMSTIAGDTVTGGTYHPRTPPKTNNSSKNNDDDDSGTQPETPPKYYQNDIIGSSVISKSFSHKRFDRTWSMRFRRLLAVAAILGVILLGAIAILSANLFQIKQDDMNADAVSSSGGNSVVDKGGVPDFDFAGIAETPTVAPSQQRLRASPQPTVPSGSPIQLTAIDYLRQTILAASPDSDLTENTPGSVAFQVLEWMAADQSAHLYPVYKIVQRFALGTLFWSLAKNETIVFSDDSDNYWMSYNDECSWKLTREEDPICDDLGIVTEIYLEEVGLTGTLSPEISLLINLKNLYLTGNEIQGELPPQLSQLTKLERLQIGRNKLEGTLPTQMGTMAQLKYLWLGSNDFEGTIPTEFSNLERLGTLGLANNQLTGIIPTELSELTGLSNVNLDSNALTGGVPAQFSNLSSLTRLVLQNNDLTGSVIEEVCSLPALEEMTVDCEEVRCDCCLGCIYNGTDSNSTQVHNNITEVQTPPADASVQDSAPSAETISAPSNAAAPIAPDSCAQISTGSSCYAPGQDIDMDVFNCNPDQLDLIGLYPFVGATISFREAIFWVRACGGIDSCSGLLANGNIFIEDKAPETLDFSAWPLEAGEYKLVLLKLIPSGVVVPIAESGAIKIDDQCSFDDSFSNR